MRTTVFPTHHIVDAQMKVLYETGWHIGNVVYFNEHLQKYYLTYDNHSKDYNGEENIDMVEVCVI